MSYGVLLSLPNCYLHKSQWLLHLSFLKLWFHVFFFVRSFQGTSSLAHVSCFLFQPQSRTEFNSSLVWIIFFPSSHMYVPISCWQIADMTVPIDYEFKLQIFFARWNVSCAIVFKSSTKGQIISKAIFVFLTSSKKRMKMIWLVIS